MATTQISALIEICNTQAQQLHSRALVHKWIANIGNFIIIAASAASGSLAAYQGKDVVSAVLSFVVVFVSSLTIFFAPERKALILERISIEVARLSRKLRNLDTVNPDPDLIKKALERAYDRLDDLKIRQFGGDASKLMNASVVNSEERETSFELDV